jgi:hypothetical protein
MRSFVTLAAFAVAATSLTAAAPVAELNARLLPFLIPIPSTVPVEFDRPKAVELKLGPLSVAARQLEGVPTGITNAGTPQESIIGSFESSIPMVSAAIASASVAVASIANEASSAFPAASPLPALAARQSPSLLTDIGNAAGAALVRLESIPLHVVDFYAAELPAAFEVVHAQSASAAPVAASSL